jgi:hypothetical protein
MMSPVLACDTGAEIASENSATMLASRATILTRIPGAFSLSQFIPEPVYPILMT